MVWMHFLGTAIYLLNIFKSMRVCFYDTISGVNFQFNKETLRFLLSQTQIQGYLINGKDADTNTIYAGTCQKF